MFTNIDTAVEEIKEILSEFTPITLEEMDGVKLMDRTDTKFVFSIGRLPSILDQIKKDYSVLHVNNHLISRYESLYFDTDNFSLYIKHHSGKLNRYKIRFRRYVESNLHFFEIKFKNNKGRTIKNRIKRKEIKNKIEGKALFFLHEKAPLMTDLLIPKLWVNYSRITLVNKLSKERVTIDIDLTFKNDSMEKHYLHLVIAEVKQEKSSSSLFLTVMKQNRIRKGSISKYCFGVISLFNRIKNNNFKSILLSINKLNHDTVTSY